MGIVVVAVSDLVSIAASVSMYLANSTGGVAVVASWAASLTATSSAAAVAGDTAANIAMAYLEHANNSGIVARQIWPLPSYIHT